MNAKEKKENEMNTMQEIAARVQRNMIAAGIDPEGDCFLVSRALQEIAAGGDLIECRLHGDHHVIYQDAEGYYWDLTAHGISGGEIQLGVEVLPEAYTDLSGYEWPRQFGREFVGTLTALQE